MAEIWEQNEEKTEDEELVVTEHRDAREPSVSPEAEEAVEVPPGENPREALEELGEDVSSSPAQRGHGELYDEEDRTDEVIPAEEAEEDREL